MADPMSDAGNEVIRVVIDAELRERFEDWRRSQRPRMPSISEGVRRLMSSALVGGRDTAAA